MKRKYESPELDLVRVIITNSLLSISDEGEGSAAGGDIVGPGGGDDGE